MALQPDQQWILSATAILTTVTRRAPRFDLLGGGPKDAPDGESTAKAILKNSWGIETREKLESTIEWLGSGGHSADYQKVAAALQSATPQQRQADPKLAFAAQYGAELGARALLAWDLARLFAVAGWGYLSGLCNEGEAWGVSMPHADRLRATYGSWEEFGHHYKLGCLFWNAEAAAQVDGILRQLAAAPDSPWKTTPWSLAAPAAAGAYGAPGAPPGYGVPGAPPGYGAPGAPQVAPAYGAPQPAPYGAAPGAPAAGPPGAAPYGAPGPLPYTPAPGAIGGAPAYGAAPGPSPYGAPPGAAPYGAPPGMPMGGAGPMLGAPGAAAVAPGGRKKMGLIIGLIVGGVLVLGLLIGLIVHFSHHEPPPAPPPGQHHGRH